MVHYVFQAGCLGSRRKSKGHNQQHVQTNSTEDVRKNSNPLPNSDKDSRYPTTSPGKLTAGTLKLPPLEKEKHLQTHPVFWGSSRSIVVFFNSLPKNTALATPPGDLGATTFAKGCSCSCRPQWEVLASIVSCRTTKNSSHNKHQKKHTKILTVGSQNHELQVLHDN